MLLFGGITLTQGVQQYATSLIFILMVFFADTKRGRASARPSFLLQKIANPFWRLDSPERSY
jgi:hypothetical protein